MEIGPKEKLRVQPSQCVAWFDHVSLTPGCGSDRIGLAPLSGDLLAHVSLAHHKLFAQILICVIVNSVRLSIKLMIYVP